MQVDFGRALAVIGGERTGVHCLVVTFPYSNMRYVVALPGENVRGVGDGVLPCGAGPAGDGVRQRHRRRAPGRVGQNHHRRRVPRFVERYRVEVKFCNPGSGWELFAR